MYRRYPVVLLVAVALGSNSCSTEPHYCPASAPVSATAWERDTYEEPWFYVAGEIRSPDGRAKLMYESAITVRQAIVSAGGFSPSANRKKVQVFSRDGGRRVVDCTERKPDEERIQRGDYVYVPRLSRWPFW